MKNSRRVLIVPLVLAVGVWVVGCGGSGKSSGDDDANIGGDGTTTQIDSGQVVIVDGGVEVHDDGGTFVCQQVTCEGKLLECGDCLDNDGDGRIDSHDQECLGPCDNTEGPALTAGVGGETGGP